MARAFIALRKKLQVEILKMGLDVYASLRLLSDYPISRCFEHQFKEIKLKKVGSLSK